MEKGPVTALLAGAAVSVVVLAGGLLAVTKMPRAKKRVSGKKPTKVNSRVRQQPKKAKKKTYVCPRCKRKFRDHVALKAHRRDSKH